MSTSLTTSNNLKLSELIQPKFQPFHKAVLDDYLYYILKGGRGSSKSSHISIEFILRRMKFKSHGLIIRKYGVYLEKSVFEQCKWAINKLGVERYWTEKKNPLLLTYKPTGSTIMFMSGEDPEKIKSIKMSDMPITDLWIEECAEFKSEDEITTMVNSIVREELTSDLKYKVFISYNPPKRRTHWLNKKYETQFFAKNTYIHQSSYLDNSFLSQQLIDEINHIKEHNTQRYEWEYLGKPTGSGIVPFDNLTFRTITTEEVKHFDNIRQGIDWGYGVDPVCFGRMHYDKTRRRLYIFDEIYGVKKSNRELADGVRQLKYTERILADSAEPKSISELREYGLNINGAKKGAGSVEYGEKWLNDLEEIIIDPKRCPNIAREFEGIDYEVDKDGNPKTRLQDKDNHSIDMVRYAMSEDMTNTQWGWK